MNQPPSKAPALRLTAAITALDEAQAFLEQQAKAAGLAPAAAQRLALALEEVFVNVCSYAYPGDEPGWIELRTHWLDGRFILDVVDAGQAFDGPSLATPDVTAALDDRSPGGLGWHLVRQMVTEVQYRREADLNVVRLILDPPPRPPASPRPDAAR